MSVKKYKTAVQKNKEDNYALIWKNVQNTLPNKQNKAQIDR